MGVRRQPRLAPVASRPQGPSLSAHSWRCMRGSRGPRNGPRHTPPGPRIDGCQSAATTAARQLGRMHGRGGAWCVCVSVCVCVCARACVRACVRACMRACVVCDGGVTAGTAADRDVDIRAAEPALARDGLTVAISHHTAVPVSLPYLP